MNFKEFYSVFDGSRDEALREYRAFGGLPKLMDINDENAKMDYLKGLFTKTYLTVENPKAH
ncbi:MAG: hypothetical protein HUK21_12160 [Fibrobacteraceae bacterium]|nr:hypothetical protein [Fibrobacteraceae bacterium]